MHRACIKLWEVTCIIAEETRSLRCEESRCGLEEDGKDLCCAFTRLRERGVYYDSMKHSRAITAQFQNEFCKSPFSLSPPCCTQLLSSLQQWSSCTKLIEHITKQPRSLAKHNEPGIVNNAHPSSPAIIPGPKPMDPVVTMLQDRHGP